MSSTSVMSALALYKLADDRHLVQILKCPFATQFTTPNTADPTWGDIFECCSKAQSSKLERVFSPKRGKETFEL